ncbi:hypothetical protein BpHYR1_047568 [Brachionus plicatilis]|uniref:Uncharacterized protein n=1 Tax=Brachionus plicatilis TaxID=10195 RepID=A0A3M7SS32_BRAPC|nr:hypothetical protein BpHYR1_047568 [Brachionus plicatilis]
MLNFKQICLIQKTKIKMVILHICFSMHCFHDQIHNLETFIFQNKEKSIKNQLEKQKSNVISYPELFLSQSHKLGCPCDIKTTYPKYSTIKIELKPFGNLKLRTLFDFDDITCEQE